MTVKNLRKSFIIELGSWIDIKCSLSGQWNLQTFYGYGMNKDLNGKLVQLDRYVNFISNLFRSAKYTAGYAVLLRSILSYTKS